MSALPSHDHNFMMSVDHWRGRGWTLIRTVDLSYKEARELLAVYRALGYADKRIHITWGSSSIGVAAA
jgi:lipocalin